MAAVFCARLLEVLLICGLKVHSALGNRLGWGEEIPKWLGTHFGVDGAIPFWGVM